MNVVEPIRDIKVLNKIRDSLKAYNKKYYFIFEYGISTGLRVSDILKLTVQDLQKDFIEIREEKTNKKKISDKIRIKKRLTGIRKRKQLEKIYIFDKLGKMQRQANSTMSGLQSFEQMCETSWVFSENWNAFNAKDFRLSFL